MKKEILKTLSLLVLVKRESEKVLCHILSIIESIYQEYKSDADFGLKGIIKVLLESEIIKANEKGSIFELTWYLFFSRYLRLGITEQWINYNVDKGLRQNPFLKSISSSKQNIFNDSNINLYIKPTDCIKNSLVKSLAVFEKEKD